MAKMWLLIGLLILASAGCTRRDWVGDMLVLTDVSGTWEWNDPMAGAVSTSRGRFNKTERGSRASHR